MAATAGEIAAFTQIHFDSSEVESLVGWIAWRTGRSQALAGAGTPLERLEHATAHWLNDERRDRLLVWLARRAANGQRPAPNSTSP